MPDEMSFDKKTLAYVLILVMSGNAGVVFLNKTNPELRADSFTGQEGKDLEIRINRIDAEQQKMIWRMVKQEAATTECQKTTQDHLRRHP